MTVPRTDDGQEPGGRQLGLGQRTLIFVSTVLVLIMLAVLPLLTPWFIHAALDASDATVRSGLASSEVHALSDRTVEELVLGPGSFTIDGPDSTPFYDEDERSHLGDARVLLWSLLIVGGFSLILIGAIHARTPPTSRSGVWRTISRAGLATLLVVVALGLVSLVAFDTVFTLFHQIFFPGGNFTFDPATQRLVQLYPFGFWQIAAGALATLLLLLSLAGLAGRPLACAITR